MSTLRQLIEVTGPHQNLVPFTPFELSFRYPVEGDKFAPDLDWDLLRYYVEAGQARITVMSTVSSHEWRTNLTAYSVWYTRKDGSKSAVYTDDDAAPIPYNDFDRHHRTLSKGTKTTIESLVHELQVRHHRRLPTLEIVTFRLTNDQVIVLDGNHRLATIYYNRGDRPLPANVVEYRIEAPLDVNLLPDLVRYDLGSYDLATI